MQNWKVVVRFSRPWFDNRFGKGTHLLIQKGFVCVLQGACKGFARGLYVNENFLFDSVPRFAHQWYFYSFQKHTIANFNFVRRTKAPIYEKCSSRIDFGNEEHDSQSSNYLCPIGVWFSENLSLVWFHKSNWSTPAVCRLQFLPPGFPSSSSQSKVTLVIVVDHAQLLLLIN